MRNSDLHQWLAICDCKEVVPEVSPTCDYCLSCLAQLFYNLIHILDALIQVCIPMQARKLSLQDIHCCKAAPSIVVVGDGASLFTLVGRSA